MMYLTKIFLNARFCRERKIRDAYSVHKVVYSLFPMEKHAGRFLYAELGATENGRQLLVLSSIVPDLPEGVKGTTAELSDNFFVFNSFHFKIIMNPVRKDSKTKKRVPIVGKLPLLQWFAEKAPQWGFATNLKTLDARILPSVVFTKGGAEQRFHQVEFCGTLHVNDAQLFRKCAEQGIGSGKAFGLGMLQLVPIQSQSI